LESEGEDYPKELAKKYTDISSMRQEKREMKERSWSFESGRR